MPVNGGASSAGITGSVVALLANTLPVKRKLIFREGEKRGRTQDGLSVFLSCHFRSARLKHAGRVVSTFASQF